MVDILLRIDKKTDAVLAVFTVAQETKTPDDTESYYYVRIHSVRPADAHEYYDRYPQATRAK